jgi:hypothetical protein
MQQRPHPLKLGCHGTDGSQITRVIGRDKEERAIFFTLWPITRDIRRQYTPFRSLRACAAGEWGATRRSSGRLDSQMGVDHADERLKLANIDHHRRVKVLTRDWVAELHAVNQIQLLGKEPEERSHFGGGH